MLNQGYYLHFSSFFEDFTAIYLDFGASHLPKFTFIFTLGFPLFRPKLLISPLRGSLFLFFKNIRFLRNRFQIGNFKFHTHYVPTERFCDYYFWNLFKISDKSRLVPTTLQLYNSPTNFCLTASYKIAPQATETFRDCVFPVIGNFIFSSAWCRTSLEIPVSSFPITMAQGSEKSTL